MDWVVKRWGVLEVEPVLEVLSVEVGSMLAMDEGLGHRRLVATRMAVVHVMPKVSWATSPVVERLAGRVLVAVVGIEESVEVALVVQKQLVRAAR